ncbi:MULTISPECIES: hypothetical protein [Mycolicibacterium]|uniref:hypothetical protein n=1 Tax=Mycolicibacterium TaxID=1866885 RepID=UPI0005669040|nr:MULTISPECIES: hypothetical protein [Mycolicibacterium]MCV7333783.1 hypothetical protein [Mycolicibacterium senegalense]MDR7292583.1 hypothetical protein [Mycolicibacterium senegalense]QZA23932.1 hypothetical protein K3U95_25355 [Mycolicibacterium senegalense]
MVAVAPIAAPLPEVQTPAISSASVQLTASTFVDPVTRWMQVFEATSANLTKIGDYIEAYPELSLPGMLDLFEAKLQGYGNDLFGGLPQVAEGLQRWATTTLTTGLQTALEQAASGQPQAAVTTFRDTVMSLLGLSSPLFGLAGFLTVPIEIMQDMADLAFAVLMPIPLRNNVVIPVLNLAWSPLVSASVTAQKIIDAVAAGDGLGALGAVINAPADAVDHFLNSSGGGLVWANRIGSTTVIQGGLLVSLLIKVPRAILTSVKPPITTVAATSVADADIASGTTVPLSTTSPGELPAGTSAPVKAHQPAAEPAAADPAPAADPTEVDAAAAVAVSSNGATDLSAGNKAVPGKIGTTSSQSRQQVRASIENVANEVNKGLNDVRDGIEKSVTGLKDRISKTTTKASSPQDATGSSEAGSSDSGSDD